MMLPLPVMRASDGMLMSVAVTAVCAVAVQAETVMAVAASMVAIERIVFFMALFFVSYLIQFVFMLVPLRVTCRGG